MTAVAPVLTDTEQRILTALQEGGPLSIAELTVRIRLDQSIVMAAAQQSIAKYCLITEQQVDELVPNADAADLVRKSLPERQALRLLIDAGGQIATGDFAKAAQQAGIAVNEVFKWGAGSSVTSKE
jgi:predicted transcriptional regulator